MKTRITFNFLIAIVLVSLVIGGRKKPKMPAPEIIQACEHVQLMTEQASLIECTAEFGEIKDAYVAGKITPAEAGQQRHAAFVDHRRHCDLASIAYQECIAGGAE